MADEKPKHKPSQKRTLEEVMKSLQDLIRNDIVGDTDAPAAPMDPEPEEAPEDEDEDEFQDALELLDHLITHEIIEPVERARRARAESIAAADDELAEIDEQAVSTDDTEAVELHGLEVTEDDHMDMDSPEPTENDAATAHPQNALPHEPPLVRPELLAEPPEISEEPPKSDEWPTFDADGPAFAPFEDEPSTSDAMRNPQKPIARDDAEELLNIKIGPIEDDIPVLRDVAYSVDADNSGAPILPGSAQSREIAIRVIARLNIERRRAGEPALDIKAIERLQRILTETLTRHELAALVADDKDPETH
ncbi:MAG: hypothetical protein HY308_08040 [Gammaproteobacteria bacterium]|nr:hypothetical protein [Gammaproteobacteria bacterium]